MLLKLGRHSVMLLCVHPGFAFPSDVRPFVGIVTIELEPCVSALIRIGQNGFRRAFRFVNAAVDALIRMNDEHVLAFVEAIDGANLDAVHALTLDAFLGDDVGHGGPLCRVMGQRAVDQLKGRERGKEGDKRVLRMFDGRLQGLGNGRDRGQIEVGRQKAEGRRQQEGNRRGKAR